MERNELLAGWETVRVLGSGGFGKVYEIRKKGDADFKSALKVVSIPQSPDEYAYYKDDGYDDQSIISIYKEQVEKMVSEFSLMSKFKGNSNVVSYEDHSIVPKKDGFGWDILIRMELLTPLPEKCNNSMPTETEIRKLGVDICHALEMCAEEKIIHRDIKPQNIFINRFEDYKLGDFGIAKSMDYASKATSKVGTYNFMAPEVYAGKPYNATADIYSLGLVLYWLLNERRLPFLPMPPHIPTAVENSEAQARRLHGERIPMPENGSSGLKAVVLKALEPNPLKRYQSAAEMRDALMNADVNDSPTKKTEDDGYDGKPSKEEFEDFGDFDKKRKEKVKKFFENFVPEKDEDFYGSQPSDEAPHYPKVRLRAKIEVFFKTIRRKIRTIPESAWAILWTTVTIVTIVSIIIGLVMTNSNTHSDEQVVDERMKVYADKLYDEYESSYISLKACAFAIADVDEDFQDELVLWESDLPTDSDDDTSTTAEVDDLLDTVTTVWKWDESSKKLLQIGQMSNEYKFCKDNIAYCLLEGSSDGLLVSRYNIMQYDADAKKYKSLLTLTRREFIDTYKDINYFKYYNGTDEITEAEFDGLVRKYIDINKEIELQTHALVKTAIKDITGY